MQLSHLFFEYSSAKRICCLSIGFVFGARSVFFNPVFSTKLCVAVMSVEKLPVFVLCVEGGVLVSVHLPRTTAGNFSRDFGHHLHVIVRGGKQEDASVFARFQQLLIFHE